MTMPRGRKPDTCIPLSAALLIAVVTAGCSGAPATSYYTLAAPSPNAAPNKQSVEEQTASIVLALGPVSLPDYLDRPQFVTRDSPYTLKLAANDRWAGPLHDMVPQVLREDLALRLPGDRVVGFPTPADTPFDYRVAAEVTRFDVDAAGAATLIARWRIYGARGGPALQAGEDFQQQQATGQSYAGYAAALSGTLAALSDSIAAGLAHVRPIAR